MGAGFWTGRWVSLGGVRTSCSLLDPAHFFPHLFLLTSFPGIATGSCAAGEMAEGRHLYAFVLLIQKNQVLLRHDVSGQCAVRAWGIIVNDSNLKLHA